MHDVIVIGGGVSGLTTAHDLVAQGFDVQILERQVRIGGNAISEKFDGYLMEHGPSTLNASVTGAMERIGALGLEASAEDLGPNVRKRFLVDRGEIASISVHPLGFFMSGYLSFNARISLAAEFMRPRKNDDAEETIYDFTARRFGAEFADKIIDPLAAGLFMGDARKLSIEGAFPKLVEMERKHGSILRGVMKAKRGNAPGRRLFSWKNGMGSIPAALATLLKGRIHTGMTVMKITPTPSGFTIATNDGTLQSRAIVLAVQPHVAAMLLEDIEPETAQAAREISAPPIGVVFLGYRREQVQHPLDGLGFLSTKSDQKTISGAQFCSTMFEGRAPDGHVSISCYTGGARNPALAGVSDADLVADVARELSELLGIKGQPAVMRTRRWTRGLPQYEVGHKARREVLGSANTRLNGVFLTGNFMNGVSIANCMQAASETALCVADMLERPNPLWSQQNI